jgi:hypothetical protein
MIRLDVIDHPTALEAIVHRLDDTLVLLGFNMLWSDFWLIQP